ncbi:MAG: AI-2E family transporter [Pseudomonadota bacterium]
MREWLRQAFADRRVVMLVAMMILISGLIIGMAKMMAPVYASVLIAFLLYPQVRWLTSKGIPHLGAVIIVFSLFLGGLILTIFAFLPLFLQQLTTFAQQIPSVVASAHSALRTLPEQYPNLVSEAEINGLLAQFRSQGLQLSHRLLGYSFSSLMGAAALLVYIFLVPFLVFFLLKDGTQILEWFKRFLPDDRELAVRVWHEAQQQFSNYVRGKFIEIMIVAAASFVVFSLLGLNYAILLAVLTGLSVLIPYVGVTVVAIPVAMVAYLQWGISQEFLLATLAYGVIQFVDGNMLAPVLLGEAVKLHPVAIVVAILFFGNIWGFWGAFFAIPMATVVNAVINAWSAALGESRSDAATRVEPGQ